MITACELLASEFLVRSRGMVVALPMPLIGDALAERSAALFRRADSSLTASRRICPPRVSWLLIGQGRVPQILQPRCHECRAAQEPLGAPCQRTRDGYLRHLTQNRYDQRRKSWSIRTPFGGSPTMTRDIQWISLTIDLSALKSG